MPADAVPDCHLAIVTDKTTGLYHGAVFRNAPTPSGSTRYLLAVTMNEGHLSVHDAVRAVNAAFPQFEPLSADAVPDDALPAGGFAIPRGALLTRITPQTEEARKEAEREGHRQVEVTLGFGRDLVDLAITGPQFDRMVELGHVRDESTSGDDPDLHYRYDHYVLTEVGRRFHPDPDRPAPVVGRGVKAKAARAARAA